MSGPVEVAATLAVTAAIAIAILIVPLPRHKPVEPKEPPREYVPLPPSEEIVLVPLQVVEPALPPTQQAGEQVKLDVIESRIARIQEKVRKLEIKADTKGNK